MRLLVEKMFDKLYICIFWFHCILLLVLCDGLLAFCFGWVGKKLKWFAWILGKYQLLRYCSYLIHSNTKIVSNVFFAVIRSVIQQHNVTLTFLITCNTPSPTSQNYGINMHVVSFRQINIMHTNYLKYIK